MFGDVVLVVEADVLPEQAQLVEVLLQLEHVLHVLLAQLETPRTLDDFFLLGLDDTARHQGKHGNESGSDRAHIFIFCSVCFVAD